MKAPRIFVALVSILLLAACGGSSSGSLETGGAARLTVSPVQSSLEAASECGSVSTQVNVRFTQANGTVVSDGTTVSLTSSNSNVGTVGPLNSDNGSGSASATTSGGTAQFRFFSGSQAGQVTLTASGNNPAGAGTVTGSGVITVTASTCEPPEPPPPAELKVIPLASSIESNPQGLAPNPRAPYTVQVNVSFRNGDGSVVPNGTEVSLASESVALGLVAPIAAPGQSGATASSPTSGGVASFWLTSGARTGTLTLTASALDPEDGGETLTATATVEIVQASGEFGPKLEVVPLATSVEANPQGFVPRPAAPYTVQVNVEFQRSNGQPVSDGTTVRLASGSAAVGVVSPLATPEAAGGTAEATTVGGTASFWFTSGSQLGLVSLTASADNPEEEGLVTAAATIEVVEALDQTGRLEISGSSTMPTNRAEVPIFLGSPYINELAVRYRGPDGTAGQVAGGAISVAVSPVSRGAFSTLDDPATDENEFLILVGSGPVAMNAGVATIFVHSFDRPGPLVVSVSAVDAETGERFSADFVIQVEDGAADFLPADISFGVSADPVYTQGSGGPTTKQLTLSVLDSGGNPVPNPESNGTAFNNVRLQLEAPAGSGARLTGTGANGSVSGTDINVRTVNGIANFALNAGTETGSHRIIATVDRADNNVDNDFQDALTAQTSINVGDGRLFALRLVSPVVNSILVNPVAAQFQTDIEPQIDQNTGLAIPPNPDGTYSYTVTVIATDRQGNPPLPGQPVVFGKVDSPLTRSNPAFFVFSGTDGDPEEGGLLFTVADPAEGFLNDPTRPDEAVEPGDTLILFGKSVPGNREHEAVRTVASVIDDRSLTVTESFNPNNQTGQVVDDGPVIPWVIGRSQVGFIDGNLTLDDRGRGSVRLTYPASAVGQPVVLWTQGSRFESAGAKTVADAQPVVFPGVSPLTLTATPSNVRGNGDATIRLCLVDGLGSPLNGFFPRGELSSGEITASLDGSSLPTTTAQATGSALAGCVDTVLSTTGMVPQGNSATVVFSIGGAVAEVEVVPPGVARLTVQPSTVTDTVPGTFITQLTLTLRDGNDRPIPGVGLTGSCNTSGGILEIETLPGITDQNGRTTARVLVGMSGCASSLEDDTFPRVGQCEFTTSSGSPVALFSAVGVDLRSFQNFLSPPPPAAFCPPLADDGEFQLIVDVRAPPGDDNSRVLSSPVGIDCGTFRPTPATTEEATDCISSFTASPVLLQAPVGTSPQWTGDCVAVPDTQRFASVDFGASGSPAVCVVEFN